MPPLNRDNFEQSETSCSPPFTRDVVVGLDHFREHRHHHDDEVDVTTISVGVLKQNRTQSPRCRRRKCVRFHEYSLQYPTIGRHDFTVGELNDAWYTAEDFSRFCVDLSKTTDLMMNEPNEIDDVKYTVRGAECRSVRATQRRRLIRSQARELVFATQKLKTNGGYRNVDLIAFHYSQFSQPAVFEALVRGDIDRIEANKIQYEEFKQVFVNIFNNTWGRPVSPDPTQYHHEQIQGPNHDCSRINEAWLHPVSA